MHMHAIVICSLSGSTIILHLVILFHKRQDLKRYIFKHNIYVLIFLIDFKEAAISSTNFREILQYQFSWKSVQ